MRVAFIGVGAMGLPMARRLADLDGVELIVHDHDPSRAAAMNGEVAIASSVAEAVEGADAIFTVLPADEHVVEVATQFEAVAEPGQIFVDFSTIGPSTMETIANRLAAKQVETVSVCLTRSTAAAEIGALALFVGGPARLSTALRRAFDSMATDVHLIGGVGAPKAFKLANNMVVSCLDIAICEALVLGRLLGFADREVTDALAANGADSWPLHNHIVKYVLPNDLGPGRFSTRYMAKDIDLGILYAADQHVPLFFASMASAYYRGTVALGHGNDYHMIVIDWLTRCANADGPREVVSVDARTDAQLIAISRGVAAVQAMISRDALTLAALAGIGPNQAAELFEHGSAGNDYLRAVSAGPASDRPPVTARTLFDDLAPVNALARSLSAPASMFEIGRQVALSSGVADVNEDFYPT